MARMGLRGDGHGRPDLETHTFGFCVKLSRSAVPDVNVRNMSAERLKRLRYHSSPELPKRKDDTRRTRDPGKDDDTDSDDSREIVGGTRGCYPLWTGDG